MRINEIKRFIKGCVAKDVSIPTLLVGSMGVGKSQIMRQIVDELGIGLVDLRLAQQESGDLIGIPYKSDDGATHWAKPEWWPKEGTKGVLFLDELNRAPNDVRQAVFQLVLDKQLHTHKLPKGWYVHAAVNPDNGNYQVETLDPAMLRRFCAIEVTPDVDVWLEWAKGAGKLDNTITEFIATNRQLLYTNEDIKIDVKPTPDSYRMLHTLMKAGVIAKEIQTEIFRGLIGKEGSIAFIKWLDKNYNKPVSGTQILRELKSVEAKIKKQRNDETYATLTDLTACVKDIKELDETQLANIVAFALMIPKESQAGLLNKLPTHTRTQMLKDQRISKLVLSIIEGERK